MIRTPAWPTKAIRRTIPTYGSTSAPYQRALSSTSESSVKSPSGNHQPSAPQNHTSSRISPLGINAFAVNQLSAAAHPSRPAPKLKNAQLPSQYQSVARKVTLAVVAAPILIVTSYVLWQRLSLGQEKKSLVKGEDEKRTNDGTRAVLEDR